MDRLSDHDQKLKTPANMDQFKGELVRDPASREFTSHEEMLKNNPYKTPPNNLTLKDKMVNQKG